MSMHQIGIKTRNSSATVAKSYWHCRNLTYWNHDFSLHAPSCQNNRTNVVWITIIIINFQTLAALVSQDDLDLGSLYPPLTTIQKCSLKIAARVAEYAYKHGKLHANLRIFAFSYLKSLQALISLTSCRQLNL
jgi:hypothetical protein